MKTTAYRLVATKGEEKIEETLRTFKQLSKRYYQLTRKGWAVALPLGER